MCIICYKPAGAHIDDATIQEMIKRNPDGAGYVYYDAADKTLTLSKGYLNANDAARAFREIPDDAPAILHARIKTHGKHAAEQTHPFPLVANTDLLEAQDLTISNGYAVAHNGVFYNMSIGDDYSDTQAFIYKVLAPLRALADAAKIDLTDEGLRPLIDAAVGSSRLAIMSVHGGAVALYGSGWQQAADGCYYSNSTYKPAPVYNWQQYYRGGWNASRKTARVCLLNGTVTIREKSALLNCWQETRRKFNPKKDEMTYYIDADGAIYYSYSGKSATKSITMRADKKTAAAIYNDHHAVKMTIDDLGGYYDDDDDDTADAIYYQGRFY